jgi:L-alanine-DL-glutamate epimerase-like enolase superfamily enzyme
VTDPAPLLADASAAERGTVPVRDATVTWLRRPFDPPLTDATHTLRELDVVVLELRDRDGRVGTAYALSFDFGVAALARCLADAARGTVGRAPAERRAIWRAAWHENEYLGREGLAAWGMAAVDFALLDLFAQQLEVPAWRLLGGEARPVPAYGSGGWTSYDRDALVASTVAYARRGFRGVKIKVGGRPAAEDAARLRAVREALGPDAAIMIDANQGLDQPRALALMHAVEDLGIRWLEEPLAADDLLGYRRLRERATIPLAMGERNFFARGVQEFILQEAIDVVMPDAMRIGGVDQWLAVATLAAARGVDVAPHFYRELDVTLAAAAPNTIWVEHFDWLNETFEWDAELVDGCWVPGATPGLGLRLSEAARSAHTVHADVV